MQFLPEIKARTDAVINITTGGGHGMTRRGAHAGGAHAFKPEMCSLNMGSMNFGLFPMRAHQGVQARLGAGRTSRARRDFIFRNTFTDIE